MREILEPWFKLKKFKSDKLYIDDAKVLVNVSIERVNAFSKSGTPTVNNPANINNSNKKVIKIKNEIFSSSSWTFR